MFLKMLCLPEFASVSVNDSQVTGISLRKDDCDKVKVSHVTECHPTKMRMIHMLC